MFFYLLLVLICLQASTTSGQDAGLCCFEFHKKPFPAASIVSYTATRPDCILPGVILTTKRGLRMCADPEVDWVRQIMKIKPST